MNQFPPLARRLPTRPAAAALAALALLTTACGGDQKSNQAVDLAPAKAAVEVIATDFGYQLPTGDIPAGQVAMTLANRGSENHHLTLVRLGDGMRADDVMAGLGKGDGSVLARTTAVGGPNGVAPGAKGTVTVDLTPGTYVAVCHIPSPQDSVSHAAKGMVSSFTVSSGAPAVTPVMPATNGTITISKGGFQVPAGLSSGSYRMQNDFDQPAEAALVKLRPGATAKDVLAFLGGQAPPGPPPFTPAGGVTTLAPRGSAVADLELTKGTYALLSFAPDLTAGGAPQFLSGLLTEVTVR